MKKKLYVLLYMILLLIPIVNANTYGANKYGCGLYGIGCGVEIEAEEAVAGAGASGAAGARGGGCNVFADEYKICYHIEPINLTCEEGCLEGYYCDEHYRCQLGKLVTKTITETILERTGDKKVIIAFVVFSLILVGLAFEIKSVKKGKEKTEKIIKEASTEVYKKEAK